MNILNKALLVGVFLMLSSVASALTSTTVVCTGSPGSADRLAIQHAVDNFNVVTLKGTCQMDGQRVYITKSNVTLKGVRGGIETDKSMPGFGRPKWLTTIRGLEDTSMGISAPVETLTPVPATLSGGQSYSLCQSGSTYNALSAADKTLCEQLALFWNRPLMITVASGNTVTQNVTVQDLKFTLNKRGVEINSTGGVSTGNLCDQTLFQSGVTVKNITVKENWFDNNQRGPQIFGTGDNVAFTNNLITRLVEKDPTFSNVDGIIAQGGSVSCDPTVPIFFGAPGALDLGDGGKITNSTFSFNDIRANASDHSSPGGNCLRCGGGGISFESAFNSSIIGNNIMSENTAVGMGNGDPSDTGQPTFFNNSYNANSLVALNYIHDVAGGVNKINRSLEVNIANGTGFDVIFPFLHFPYAGYIDNAGITLGSSNLPGLVYFYPYLDVGPSEFMGPAVGYTVALNLFSHNLPRDVLVSEGAGGNTIVQPGANIQVACRCLNLLSADYWDPSNPALASFASSLPAFVDLNGVPLHIPATNTILPRTACTPLHLDHVINGVPLPSAVTHAINSDVPVGIPVPALDFSICSPSH